MGKRSSQAEQLEHRIEVLLGSVSAKGVLPLEFNPAHWGSVDRRSLGGLRVRIVLARPRLPRWKQWQRTWHAAQAYLQARLAGGRSKDSGRSSRGHTALRMLVVLLRETKRSAVNTSEHFCWQYGWLSEKAIRRVRRYRWLGSLRGKSHSAQRVRANAAPAKNRRWRQLQQASLELGRRQPPRRGDTVHR